MTTQFSFVKFIHMRSVWKAIASEDWGKIFLSTSPFFLLPACLYLSLGGYIFPSFSCWCTCRSLSCSSLHSLSSPVPTGSWPSHSYTALQHPYTPTRLLVPAFTAHGISSCTPAWSQVPRSDMLVSCLVFLTSFTWIWRALCTKKSFLKYLLSILGSLVLEDRFSGGFVD